MNLRQLLCILSLAPACMAQIAPGQGAPNEYFRIRFLNAYFRNGFSNLVSGATTNVAKFGSAGLNQEFSDAANASGTRYALVKPDLSTFIPASGIDVFQVFPLIYGTYKGGVNTYGYPITDTMGCAYSADQSCQYQLFDKNYALFGYNPALFAGQVFATRDPYLTKWSTLGGINRLGSANTAETAVTSSVSNAAATMQGFTAGAIYNITSGVLNGRLYAVRSPIYGVYSQNGGHAGYLGYPAGEELVLANGNLRQSFEGGAIEYDPVTQATFLRPGVRVITILGDHSAAVQLKVGDTYTATVQAVSVSGDLLTDRTVNWLSSNGRVMAVTGSGYTGTFSAAGAGTANITAVIDGKASAAIQFVVSSLCCQIGEGAPNFSMQQMFRDAVTRNKLNLQVPAPGPVQRVGSGYYQEIFSASDGARYILALPDQSATAWIMTGPILSRYLELGGFTGSLGYPAADPTPGGRQQLANGALAGNPVQLVTAPILAKWAFVGYETGTLGAPTGAANSFQTYTEATGTWQSFAKGNIYSLLTGGQAGRSYIVAGVILTKYSSLGAFLGKLGAPISDEVKRDNRGVQEFEGGTLDYGPGDTDATVTFRPRKPAVDATPAVVSAGSRAHLRVSGFDDNSTLRISITGQPDFVVVAPSGAYTWDSYFPSSTPSGTITIRAATLDGQVVVTGSFTVRSAIDAKVQLAIVDGNNQVAGPGAILARPLKVVVRDSSRNPISGLPVTFEPSPGAQIVFATPMTDSNGEAQAVLRAPAVAGVALVSVRISSDMLTFQALVTSSNLLNFPRQMQSGDSALGDGGATIAGQGAMLAATSSILRYYQNHGDVGSPQGLADPATLNQYLSTFCAGTSGSQLCDGYLVPSSGSPGRIVNLWRLSGFTGANVDAIAGRPDLAVVRENVGQGRPVLLALALSMDGVAIGSHYVVAIGVQEDGNIAIHDPNPELARGFLSEYLTGFTAGERSYKATLLSVATLIPRAPAASGFLVTSNNVSVSASSASGSCGTAFETLSVAAVPGSPASSPVSTFRALFCDGQAPFYQLDSSSRDPYRMTLTDLGAGGARMDLAAGGDAAFKVVKSGSQWTTAPADVSFTASSAVNAATFQAGVAPGGLMAIFGTGLARTGVKTQVDVAGQPATVIAASPFQLNVQVPPQTAPGTQAVTVRSPYGSLLQPVEIRRTAPGIFVLGGRQGAIVNQDGSINSPLNPLPRGQVMVIYCTGLGAVVSQGAYQIAAVSPTVSLQGRELQPVYAGLTPSFVGLYQVNVTVPADLPPGLGVSLSMRQDSSASNTVEVSIQ